MTPVKYQITLSIDGNHSVSVSGDDQASVNEGLAWARGIYLKLKERSAAPTTRSEVIHHDISPGQPPACAIHKLPMTLMSGKQGRFWSCHEKLDDGSWCPYKPGKGPS